MSEAANRRLYVRQCFCEGTASGPRIIMRPVETAGGWQLRCIRVQLACDVCDEPWEPMLDGQAPKPPPLTA